MAKTLKDSPIADRIAVVAISLMAIGTVFVFSASADISRDISFQQFYSFAGLRQLLFFPLAVGIMYIVSCIDYHRFGLTGGWFKSPIVYLLSVSIVLLVLVLIPQIGTEVNNARRWLKIPAGPLTISFQPSELAKWLMIIFLSGFCSSYGDRLRSYWKVFIPVCLIIGTVAGLVLKEDFGTAALISLLSFLLLVFGGTKLWYIATLLPAGLVAFAAALVSSPARMKRIEAFLRPEELAGSAAYQANQSLIALGSGGLFGRGLGRGICKYGHLPEDTTDFIFAIVGEEMGFVGTAAVILLFIIFVWLGILVIIRSKDYFGQMLASGIVLSIAIQAALNIGVVTVVLPTKGIPLPFVSAGGTSMLLTAAAVGILLNIAKQSSDAASQEQPL